MIGAITRGHWRIPWLQELPAHWEVVSSKQLFFVRKELAREYDQQLAATQAYGVISQKEFERRVGRRVVQITQNLEKRRHVEKDDFVISMRSFQGGLERAWETGCIRSSYVVLKPSDRVHVGFFQYVFKSHGYIQALQATSNFIRDGQDLNISNFSLVDLPLPPREEQHLLARFLDWHGLQTAKLIRTKKKLIALLNEQKQAIIHCAVTQGLDPNVKLKPSGIPWLGNVPEGWKVKRLKTVCRINPSKLGIKVRNTDGLATFLPMERVSSDGQIDCSLQQPVSEFATGFTFFQRNDVILAKITPCFENGKGAVLDALPTEVGFGSTEFIVLRASSALDPRFLYLLTFEPQFRRLGVESMTGSAGQQRISPEFVANYVVAVPDREEQVLIIEALRTVTRVVDATIDAANREIALVQEFRTRLIADVVTGKLDVRAAAASLPENTEFEPIEELPGDEDLEEAINDSENEEVAA
ncbi:MAG: restriction endonuclease subunit S [Beijerinckiaceae bacterium]